MPNNENHNLVALIKKYKEFSKDIESAPIGHHHFGDKMLSFAILNAQQPAAALPT